MPAPSKTMLVAAIVGIGSLAFAGGFAASSATADTKPAAPIVNVDAWSETAPAPAVRLASANADQPETVQCNPWEVSDIAMEEVLREMQRRGWRQPRQGDATESLVSLGVEGIGAVDPEAPMPTEGGGRSMIAVLSDDQAEQLRTEQVSLDQLIGDAMAVQTPN